MKVLISFLSVLASVVSIFAVLVSLRGNRPVQDRLPETSGQKALRIGAAIWLVLFGLVMLLLAGAFVLPAIIKLFV